MPELSIVIPVYKETRHLAPLVTELLNAANTELIVVDGDAGSSIGTLRPHKRLKTLVSAPGRALQMNRGAAQASSSRLLFLHADTRPPADFCPLIVQALHSFEAGAFSLSIRTRHPIVSFIGYVTSLRARLSRVPFGDQGQFFRKESFFRLGGYETVPVLEDLAMMLTLRHRRIPIRILPQRVHTSDRRWRKEGILACMLRNWLLRIKYRCGIPPFFLSRYYQHK